MPRPKGLDKFDIGIRKSRQRTDVLVSRGAVRSEIRAPAAPPLCGVLLETTRIAPLASQVFSPEEFDKRIKRYQELAEQMKPIC